MAVARAELEALGWDEIKDVSGEESYDFYCRTGDLEAVFEVKGTTSHGDTIILTRNEVDLHKERHPNNCLIVVRDIVLNAPLSCISDFQVVHRLPIELPVVRMFHSVSTEGRRSWDNSSSAIRRASSSEITKAVCQPTSTAPYHRIGGIPLRP
jgi:hypothetical protein